MRKQYFYCIAAAVFLAVLLFIFYQAYNFSFLKQRGQERKDELFISIYVHKIGEAKNISLHEYLIDAMAAEMPAGFLVEELKAQAVAGARTYILKRINEKGAAGGVDICDEFRRVRAWVIR